MDSLYVDQTICKQIRTVFENHMAAALIEARALLEDLQVADKEVLRDELHESFTHDGAWADLINDTMFETELSLKEQVAEIEDAEGAREARDLRSDYYRSLINVRAAE